MEVLVDPKQPANKLTLSLVAGGVISGRVLNPRGEPLAGGPVTALGTSYIQGYPILYQESSVIADERGNFRLWGLHPGSYYIRAHSTDPQGVVQYTYFPGAHNTIEAQTITVASAGEFKGADFSLQQGTSRIQGSLVITPPSLAGPRRLSGNGTPLPYTVGYFLVPVDTRNAVDIQTVWAANRSYTGDDRLEISGVRPGNYVLYAVLSPERAPGDPDED